MQGRAQLRRDVRGDRNASIAALAEKRAKGPAPKRKPATKKKVDKKKSPKKKK